VLSNLATEGIGPGEGSNMATPESKPLGVTDPLSTALPTESENQASNALIEELKRQNNYESHADTQKRYVAPAKRLYITLCNRSTVPPRFQGT